jgi:hypothetical protein
LLSLSSSCSLLFWLWLPMQPVSSLQTIDQASARLVIRWKSLLHFEWGCAVDDKYCIISNIQALSCKL